MTDQGAGSAHESSASAAELVLGVKELAEHLAVHLARVGDANDLGRAACVCKALSAACASERAWELACTARLPTAAAARESLSGSAASSFSWRRHFVQRVRGGACTVAELLTPLHMSLADSALLLVDVWHNGTLAFSASLTPAAQECLEDECYSDSDDQHMSESKQQFAIANKAREPNRYGYGRSPAFVVDAGRLLASAWLLRRDGRLERLMCRAPADLEDDELNVENSIVWGPLRTRRVVFEDGTRPGAAVRLHMAGWLVEAKTGYRWWPNQGVRPPASDLRRLTRMCVRWLPAARRSAIDADTAEREEEGMR
jgi:hypothetical protein